MTSPRDGRYIEQIGTFNPMLPKDHADRLKLNLDRAKHWLSVGAQPTDRVARFLDTNGLMKREARNNLRRPSPARSVRSAKQPPPTRPPRPPPKSRQRDAATVSDPEGLTPFSVNLRS